MKNSLLPLRPPVKSVFSFLVRSPDPPPSRDTLATAAFVLQWHDRLGNLAAPACDNLALSLDERRLPKRIRRPRP